MMKNRTFNVFVAAALVTMVALIVGSSVATTRIARAAGTSGQVHLPGTAPLCDFPVVERSAIHWVFVKGANNWFTYSDNGPTGLDGGLIHLLSDSQACSG
jgi:hypothetical protein